MPRFFVDRIEGDKAFVTGDDAKHITKVLRLRAGEQVTLSDGAGLDYIGEAVSFGDMVTFRIVDVTSNITEPTVRISLYQAVPKGDKLEQIVQKAVELGVADITPVLTVRCVARPEPDAMAKRIARLQRVALEAAKQSGRGIVPTVRPMLDFAAALTEMTATELPILCYEAGGNPLGRIVTGGETSVALMIGSEGGFAPQEAEATERAGIRLATLGSRILRCETAPIAALSVLLHLTSNL